MGSKKSLKLRPFAVVKRTNIIFGHRRWAVVVGSKTVESIIEPFPSRPMAQAYADEHNAAAEAWRAERCEACPLYVDERKRLDEYIRDHFYKDKKDKAESAGLGDLDEDDAVCVVCGKHMPYDRLVAEHTPCPEITKLGWDGQYHGFAEVIAGAKPKRGAKSKVKARRAKP